MNRQYQQTHAETRDRHRPNDQGPSKDRNTRIDFSAHARDRLRQYDVRDADVRVALGPRIVDAAGAFTCRDAVADHRQRLLENPETGAPLRLGTGFAGHDRCRGRGTRTLLLVVLSNDRRLHVVCAPYPDARLEIVTLWDPEAPQNKDMWTAHAQLPTQRGARILPYCRWLLGEPSDPRRPTFHATSAPTSGTRQEK